MLFVDVLNEREEVTRDILVPWICCYAVASVVSIAALAFKIKIFIDQLRERRSTFDEFEECETGNAKKLRDHQKRLAKVSRKILLLYSSMMIGLAEGVPLGVLQSMHSHTCECAWHDSACANMSECVALCARDSARSCVLPACGQAESHGNVQPRHNLVYSNACL